MPAFEFTPELNERYLASLMNRIGYDEASAVGAAQTEGEAAGLVGLASTGSKVGAARAAAARQREAATAGLGMDLARMRREERLTGEARDYQSTEAQRAREFQMKLAQFDWAQRIQTREAQERAAKIGQQQGMVTGALGTAAELGAAYFSGGASLLATQGKGFGLGKGGAMPVDTSNPPSYYDDLYGGYS